MSGEGLSIWDGDSKLLPPAPGRGGPRGPILVSVLLHGVVLALLLVVLPRRPPSHDELPPGVAVVFESGANRAPTVPNPSLEAPRPGQATPAAPPLPPLPLPPAAPPPSPPPAPAPVAPAPPAPAPLPMPPVPVPPAPLLPAQPAPSTAPETTPVPAPSTQASVAPPETVRLPSQTSIVPPLSLTAPLPLPPVPPPVTQPPRRAAIPPHRPAPNPLAGFGIPLTGHWALGRPSGSELAGAYGPTARGRELSTSPLSNLSSPDAPASWLNSLSDWIQQHLYYPRAAGEQGQEGEVTVAVQVDRYGRVLSVSLEQSARYPLLDMALQGMFRGRVVPPFPGGEGPDKTTVHVTVDYSIVR